MKKIWFAMSALAAAILCGCVDVDYRSRRRHAPPPPPRRAVAYPVYSHPVHVVRDPHMGGHSGTIRPPSKPTKKHAAKHKASPPPPPKKAVAPKKAPPPKAAPKKAAPKKAPPKKAPPKKK